MKTKNKEDENQKRAATLKNLRGESKSWNLVSFFSAEKPQKNHPQKHHRLTLEEKTL